MPQKSFRRFQTQNLNQKIQSYSWCFKKNWREISRLIFQQFVGHFIARPMHQAASRYLKNCRRNFIFREPLKISQKLAPLAIYKFFFTLVGFKKIKVKIQKSIPIDFCVIQLWVEWKKINQCPTRLYSSTSIFDSNMIQSVQFKCEKMKSWTYYNNISMRIMVLSMSWSYSNVFWEFWNIYWS